MCLEVGYIKLPCKCKYLYHYRCLKTWWYNKEPKCPQCSRNVENINTYADIMLTMFLIFLLLDLNVVVFLVYLLLIDDYRGINIWCKFTGVLLLIEFPVVIYTYYKLLYVTCIGKPFTLPISRA